ncbi:MAG: hypothetical protein JEZ02_14330 [Desulfatibacillum sp.]|nr:hypothetical protein [Desulfatibacillum sp.]
MNVMDIFDSMDKAMAVSFCALLVSILGALYSRRCAVEAAKANKIANEANGISKEANHMSRQTIFRPARLSGYQYLLNFLDFCSNYSTKHSHKFVQGTRQLMERVDKFEKDIEELGPMEMPEVEMLINEAVTQAQNLQRVLDLKKGQNPKAFDVKFNTAEEKRWAIEDWFTDKKSELKMTVEPYLGNVKR